MDGNHASIWAGSNYQMYDTRDHTAASTETSYGSCFVEMNSGEQLVQACGGPQPRWAFSSMHDGGCQFALADGSVRLISSYIDSMKRVNARNHLDTELWRTYQHLQVIDAGATTSF